jgi:hypothetical protein
MSVFLQPIYTQTVGSGGAASVTFNNIPQTFTDLKVVISGRTNRALVNDEANMYINNSSSSIYSSTRIQGDGSGATSTRTSAYSVFINWGDVPGASATSNTFGNLEIYIPNYTSSNFKSLILDTVLENNATYGTQSLYSGLWASTAAITSLSFNPRVGPNFVQYSTFSLYGILRQGI